MRAVSRSAAESVRSRRSSRSSRCSVFKSSTAARTNESAATSQSRRETCRRRSRRKSPPSIERLGSSGFGSPSLSASGARASSMRSAGERVALLIEPHGAADGVGMPRAARLQLGRTHDPARERGANGPVKCVRPQDRHAADNGSSSSEPRVAKDFLVVGTCSVAVSAPRAFGGPDE